MQLTIISLMLATDQVQPKAPHISEEDGRFEARIGLHR